MKLHIADGGSADRGRRPGSQSGIWAALIVVVATISLYAPCLENGFVYDDFQLIVDQPAPQSIADLLGVFTEPHCPQLPYYRPLARVTMVAQRALHDDTPAGYQALNLMLASALGLSVYWLLRSPKLGNGAVPTLLASLLIVTHPIASCCVYSVSSGREALLCSVLAVCAVSAYLRKGRGWYLLSLLSLSGALLSKEQAIVLPFVFLVADLSGLSGGSRSRSSVGWLARLTPVVAIVGGYLYLRARLFAGQEFDFVFLESPTSPLLSLLYALQVIASPSRTLLYEPGFDAWFSWPRTLLAILITLGVAGWAVRFRSALRSQLWFWLAWMALSLLPSANIVRQEVEFAERWLLLFSVGAFGLICALLSSVWSSSHARIAILVTLLGVLACFATMTWRRGSYYADSSVFCRQWLQSSPSAASAHAHMGYLAYNDKRYDEAVESLRRAAELCELCEAVHWSLGNAYAALEAYDLASSSYEEALKVNPLSVEARLGLGSVLAKTGALEAAASKYREALSIDPSLARGYFSLGGILEALGERDLAIETHSEALRQRPDYAEARKSLAKLLVQKGRLSEGIEEYMKAVRNEPDNASLRGMLANALLRAGRRADAITQYSEVLRLDPRSAEAHFNLGLALSRSGEVVRATQHYSSALESRAEWPAAMNNLAWIMATHEEKAVRNPERAVELAEELCQLVSEHAVALDTLAAAYAAVGRFQDAVTTAQKALRLVADEKPALARDIEQRLLLYEAGQAYREATISPR